NEPRDEDPGQEWRRDREDASEDHQHAECHRPPGGPVHVGSKHVAKRLRHIPPKMTTATTDTTCSNSGSGMLHGCVAVSLRATAPCRRRVISSDAGVRDC